MKWLRRFAAIFRNRDLDQEHEEELQFHLAMREQLNAEQGMSDADAQRLARVRFGNPTVWRERMKEIDLLLFPQTVAQDIRFGIRMLVRNGGFTAAAVFALAVGIGINTATFTAYRAFFKRGLDAQDAGRMANLALIVHTGATNPDFSYPDYETYRSSLHSFSGLIARSKPQDLTIATNDGVVRHRNEGAEALMSKIGLLPQGASVGETATTLAVSGNYFSVLGVHAVRGRELGDQDGLQAPVVMISENYWQKRFGGDPAIIGKSIRLNGAAVTIVGVAPHNFVGTFIEAPDFWMPLQLDPLVHPGSQVLEDRESTCCTLNGRLAQGVDPHTAQEEFSTVGNHLRALHNPHSVLAQPVSGLVWRGSPFALPLESVPGLTIFILLVMAAAGMVLVVACANVASLQLARAAARQNELSMRISLGASRVRLIRQLLTESALLGLMAGVLGFLLSWGFLQTAVVLIANAFPEQYGTFVFHVTPDPAIFAFAFIVSLSAGVLFGLAPALESSRSPVASALKANSTTSPTRTRRLRGFLIATQVAMSAVLVIAGSLLIHSAIRALNMETGYDDAHTIDVTLQFPETAAYTAEHKAALIRTLRARLASLPGVVDATSARAPDDQELRGGPVTVNGDKPTRTHCRWWVFYTWIEPNYFRTLNIPLVLGRELPDEAGEPEPLAIVSESAARELWPGENPLGRTLRIGTDGEYHPAGEAVPDGPSWRVIGVAHDTRGVELDGGDSAQIYLPRADPYPPGSPILLRTHSDPAQFNAAIGEVIASVDPNLVAESQTLEQMLRQTAPFLASTLSATVASTTGLLGLLLAAIGIYGTVSYVVVLRTREVGIRMALGAKKGDILRLILRESSWPVLAGLGAGMLLAGGVAYLLRHILFGIHTIDWLSFGGVPALFLAIALVAALIPSRRAMRVEPLVALRYE